MKCYKCQGNIELVDKKNPDTKMWYNYWHCEKCGQTQPSEGGFIGYLTPDDYEPKYKRIYGPIEIKFPEELKGDK